MKSKLLLAALGLCSFSVATAQSFTSNGFTYLPSSDNTVTLTASSVTSGDVTVPQTVENDGKTYTVTAIGERAFYNTKVASVTLPTTVTKLGKEAFRFCMSMESLKGTENVDSIMGQALATCRNMTDFDWPKNLKYVGPNAFTYDTGLTYAVSFPKGVTLEQAALAGMGIDSLTINGQPSYVGAHAFQELDKLKALNLNCVNPPDFIPYDVFSDDWDEADASGVTLFVPTGAKANYESNDNWNGFFAAIEEKAFENPDDTGGSTGGGDERKDSVLETYISADSSVVRMHVADAGTLIEVLTKKLRDKVTNLTLSGKLNGTDIVQLRRLMGVDVQGYSIDDFTPILDTLDITLCDIVEGGDPYFVTSTGSYYTSNDVVGSNMFSGCPSLVAIYLPKYATRIQSNAFSGTANLRHVGFSDLTEFIGETAFYDSGIDSLELPDNISSFGDMVFYDCQNLKYIKLPAKLRTIPFATFYFCTGLQDVTLPENLTTIGSLGFFNCNTLPRISIPASVATIDNSAFNRCKGIQEFDVAPANSSYASVDGVLFNKSKDILLHYTTGNPRTTYELPASVETISEDAFWESEILQEVTLGENVRTINGGAFQDCTGLTKVTVNAVTPPACYNADDGTSFSGVDISNVALVVPEQSVDAYREAAVWKDFGTINNVATGISGIAANPSNNGVEAVYSLSGERLSAPAKGINIIRYHNGRTVKIMVK